MNMNPIEQRIRAAAYHIFNMRDGYHQLRKHTSAFRNLVQLRSAESKRIAYQGMHAILSHAYKSSPYYRETWKAIDIDPTRLRFIDDISQFPLIDKEIIKASKDDMVSRHVDPNNRTVSYTGGTSGTQTSFFIDNRCIAARMGRQWGILERCGYSPGHRCGLIWGVHDDLPDNDKKLSLKGRLRQFATAKETLDCAVLTPEKMIEFHRRLVRFKPSVLYGYPDAMSHFARFTLDENLSRLHVESIICTAEKLTRKHRNLLKSTFSGEVYNLYCTREHGCIGFECNHHRGFHIDIGSMWVEILKDGNPVASGQKGEIVITDFNNRAMPFIRYRIGDIGSLSSDPCPCGCELPLLMSLDGRVTDTLKRPDGSKLDGGLLTDVFIDVEEIKALQIVQTAIDQVVINLVVTAGFNDQTKKRVYSEMQPLLGDDINISIKILDDIRRNPVSGKYQEVICKIP
jgi:phenylacetate-CoA ligase